MPTRAWTGAPLPSPFGMRLLTYAFIALVIPLAAVTRRQPGVRRAAVGRGAVHLCGVSVAPESAASGAMPRGRSSCWVITRRCRSPWPSCIRIFPFALRPTIFLKRVLTAGRAWSVPPSWAWPRIGAIHSPDLPLRDPRDVGVLVTFWGRYPRCCIRSLRELTGWFVDAVLLDRPDYATFARRSRASRAHSPACGANAGRGLCAARSGSEGARTVEWHEHPASALAQVDVTRRDGTKNSQGHPGRGGRRGFQLLVGGLIGGRRLPL